MHDQLEPYGIMQFVRSGRIAVTKATMPITALLEEYENMK
jgi:acetolactate synthase-1/3 small subunit